MQGNGSLVRTGWTKTLGHTTGPSYLEGYSWLGQGYETRWRLGPRIGHYADSLPWELPSEFSDDERWRDGGGDWLAAETSFSYTTLFLLY